MASRGGTELLVLVQIYQEGTQTEFAIFCLQVIHSTGVDCPLCCGLQSDLTVLSFAPLLLGGLSDTCIITAPYLLSSSPARWDAHRGHLDRNARQGHRPSSPHLGPALSVPLADAQLRRRPAPRQRLWNRVQRRLNLGCRGGASGVRAEAAAGTPVVAPGGSTPGGSTPGTGAFTKLYPGELLHV